MEYIGLFIWLLSPLALIPLFIVFAVKNKNNKEEIFRLRAEINRLRNRDAGLTNEFKKPEHVEARPVTLVDNQPDISTINQKREEVSSQRVMVSACEKAEPTIVIPHKEKKETAKGTVLFGIGVFFVLLAGVIFATTTWKILPSIAKVFTLLAAVLVFYISSFIAEKKLKLRETSITFYALGSCFLAVINISIAFFEWFSQKYSFNGDTGYLVVAISLSIVTLCLFVGKRLYELPALEMASMCLSVVDVVLFSLFFTKSMGLIVLIIGAYLWILFGVLYVYEYQKKNVFLLKALSLMATLYQFVTVAAVFSKGFYWVIPVAVVAIAMYVPKMLLSEKAKEGYIKAFDRGLVLYCGLILIRADYLYDINVTAIIAFMAPAFGLLFKYVKFPKIGRLKNNISDFTTILLLAVSLVMLMADGLVSSRVANPNMHMIHLYVIFLLSAAISLWEIVFKKAETSLEKKYLYVEAVFAIGLTGWLKSSFYETGNIIAFALILLVCFLWQIKLKAEDSREGIILSVMSCIEGALLVILSLIEDASLWKLAVVVLLLGLQYFFFDKNKYEYVALAPMLLIYTLAYRIVKLTVSVPENQYIIRAVVCLAVMVVAIVIGRIRYKMLKDEREGHEGIDWIGALSLILSVYCISFHTEIGLLSLALYLFGYYKRIKRVGWQITTSAATLILGHLVCNQPIFNFPDLIKAEAVFFVAFLALVAGGFIWKDRFKIYSYVSSAVLFLTMLSYAALKLDSLFFVESGLQRSILVSVVFLVVVSLCVGLIGFLTKNTIFTITCGLILMESSIITGSMDRSWIGIATLLVGALYGFYLCLIKKEQWLVLPLLQLYIYLLIYEDVASYVWVIIYLVSMAHGIGLFRKIYSNEDGVRRFDFYTILSIIPTLVLFCRGDDKWGFCASMMLVLYILSMYKRVNSEIADKFILTLSSILLCITIIRQPFFGVPGVWNTEWILCWVWAALLFNTKVVFKEHDEDSRHVLLFFAAIISVIWQATEAITTERAVDAIILSACMALLLVYSFYAKKKAWLLLALITLVVQGIYASREFWKSIAWWVYILIVGVIFIALAAKNEYNKRNVKEKEKHVLLEDWGKW